MKKITAHILGEIVYSNDSNAHSLYEKSRFGEKIKNKIQYSLSETLFLVEKNKMKVFSRNKKLSFEDLMKRFRRFDKKIQIKFPVFKDLREKGYIIKTALKFGAEFRVYEKGKKPGQKHAKWIVFTDHESKKVSLNEFSARNRVAHSTKKNLLLAIVDEEESITYYEVSWVKV